MIRIREVHYAAAPTHIILFLLIIRNENGPAHGRSRGLWAEAFV